MLPKMRDGAWRLRWGAVALAVIVPLALPMAASADEGPTAAANSIQYINVAINPPAGIQTAESDNSVLSTVTGYGHPFKIGFRFWQSNAPLVTVTNYAEADSSNCGNCSAVGIAFQVVLVSKQTLAELTATDAAEANSNNCSDCHSLAEAFQIVYATDNWSGMKQIVMTASLRTVVQLQMLKYLGLSTGQIQARSTDLINDLISFLQNGDIGGAGLAAKGWSPAINGAGQTTQLTSNTQPVIDLLSEFQH